MKTNKKIFTTPLRISLVVLLLGMLMKILEWQFALHITFMAFLSTGVLYAVRFWKKDPKLFLDYVKLTLVTFWTTNGIFRIMDLPYTIIFQIIIGISFVTWFILEGSAYFMDDQRGPTNNIFQLLWNFAMVIGTMALIVGGLLKILHWEYSTHLLVLGILIIASYILKDVFTNEKIVKEDHNEEYLM